MLGSPRRLAPLVALGRSDRERRQTGPRGRTAVRTRREGHDDRVTRVGLVSDMHLPRFGAALPRALERGLRRAGVTRILHLGDMTDPLVVPLFESIAPFDAVAGNNDGAPQPAFERAWQRGPEAREMRVADEPDAGHTVIVPLAASSYCSSTSRTSLTSLPIRPS